MEVPINKVLGAAGAPKLDVIRMTRSPGEGGVVFLSEKKETPSLAPLIDTTPLLFFYFTFFLPLEWNSSPSLVAAVFNAFYGGAPPGSGRIGVIGAQPLVAYQDNEK